MKRVSLFLAVILLLAGVTVSPLVHRAFFTGHKESSETFYVGVSFCGDTVEEAKLLIDRVRGYTNLFVLQSGSINDNETAVNRICDYVVAAGLHFIVYFGWFSPDHPWQVSWLDYAEQRWDDRFLGVYYYDEPGGIQIDYNWEHMFARLQQRNSSLYQQLCADIEAYLAGTLPRDYDEAAKRFLTFIRESSDLEELENRSITAFTSDYALYWFDYLGGYDTVFAQLGWNHTVTKHIALCRGAANLQNKSWGTIVTWKYKHPPYLASGEEIYQRMRMSYEAGAKYTVIFNYPEIEGNPYGVMFEEHFEVLKRFWKEVVQNPQVPHGSKTAEAALVLPRNYGWGMRKPQDRIWYWKPDEKSPHIWNLSQTLLEQYRLRLDIVYRDPRFPAKEKYSKVYHWNQTA